MESGHSSLDRPPPPPVVGGASGIAVHNVGSLHLMAGLSPFIVAQKDFSVCLCCVMTIIFVARVNCMR